MATTGIGDAAQQFTFARNTSAIKSQLATLANSLSTGKVGDLTASLGGDTARYSTLSYDLGQVSAFLQTAGEVQLSLANRQTALDRFEGIRGDQSATLLRVTDLSNDDQIAQAARSATAGFGDLVDVLNMRTGDRSLFAGTSIASPAVTGAGDMLDAIVASLPPAASVADIMQATSDYFMNPAGGFATTGYLGSATAGPALRVSEDRQVAAAPAANDPRFRVVLAAAAMAAMADRVPGLSVEDQRALLNTAGQRLQVAGDDVTSIRADIGASEETVNQALGELQARRTTLGIARNTLDQADPFETATELQAIQLRLETHFSAMARLSQLSLLRFI